MCVFLMFSKTMPVPECAGNLQNHQESACSSHFDRPLWANELPFSPPNTAVYGVGAKQKLREKTRAYPWLDLLDCKRCNQLPGWPPTTMFLSSWDVQNGPPKLFQWRGPETMTKTSHHTISKASDFLPVSWSTANMHKCSAKQMFAPR